VTEGWIYSKFEDSRFKSRIAVPPLVTKGFKNLGFKIPSRIAVLSGLKDSKFRIQKFNG
jgi:hypothetical protein